MADIKTEKQELQRPLLSTSPPQPKLSVRLAMALKISMLALIVGLFVCLHYPAFSSAAHNSQKHTPLGLPYTEPPIAISNKIQNARPVPFKPNDGWLGMNLDYKYVEPLAKELNSTSDVPLQTRGEAHITVVTPPEFNVLKEAGITLDELNAIALDMDIQSLSFVLICLGREKVTKDGKDYIVYQGIVDAPSLTNIRNAIFRRYASKGGNTALFDPQNYKPHFTIAYNVGDLFESDHVSKGYNVCYRPFKITN
ncbi:hypothetical protein VTP01DRAFT_6658 [Rhizomucor pusillus]|uniref:uncharacterized protein n=1 Tax=Rhizomucor pusillus TaxID=4840 RepID=UPI00374482E4